MKQINKATDSESSELDVAYSKTEYSNGIDELILPKKGHCFHCGDRLPNPPFEAVVLGETRLMCCMGCQLAAESIVEAGLEQYYLDRSEINRTASMPTELDRLRAYDHDEIKSQFVYNTDGQSVAELSVSNLRCAACTWLIETRLYEMDGVKQCQVNLTNQRMRVIWDEKKLPISDILLTINQIGYDAKPYRQDTHEAMLARHNKQMLIRLGIAALGAMQAMMYAVGMYFGDYSGMLVEHRDFLRWVSLFVSVPVFFYCAIPFFTSAWSAVKARQVNMDVPVSIALAVTFFASLYATISGQGETYYDSVSMFVFFLLAGRYIEHNARLKAANMANDLVVVEPTLVKRLSKDTQLANTIIKKYDLQSGADDSILSSNAWLESPDILYQLKRLGSSLNTVKSRAGRGVNRDDSSFDTARSPSIDSKSSATLDTVTAQSLHVGDVILIDAGSEIVADGILCSDTATVSQSLLTGESQLLVKNRGDYLIGGSQNDSQPFVMLVTSLPEDSQIALIDRLMNRAMSEKPKIAVEADKWARWFVARILLLSVLVFTVWYFIDPTRALWITVSVLVATCPCALSLATPIALTVSTNRLAQYGFLTTRGHTLQTIAEMTHVAFDKTGTLTYGKPNLLYIDVLEDTNKNSIQWGDLNDDKKETVLAIAAALEIGSRHPIASALLDAAYQLHLPKVTDLVFHPAGGVEAIIQDSCIGTMGAGYQYRLGHVDFALGRSDQTADDLKDALPTLYNVTVTPDLEKYQATTAVMLSRTPLNSVDESSNSIQGDDVPATVDNGKVWTPLALFYFNDSIREGVAGMMSKLQSRGLTTTILTGDPSEHANIVAKTLGVDEMYKGLSPADKVNHIKTLQQNGDVVMMIGDGINDAPVLGAANVSTAIAGAADLAQVSSDSVILNGAVTAVYDAKRIADKSQLIIKQNIRWAIGYNSIVLIPAAFGYVPPWLAAIGMSLSSLFVVMNALRLRKA